MPRGFALSCVAHPGTKTDPLQQCVRSLPDGGSCPGEWMMNPQIMEHILPCYSCARIDLFTSRENTNCELFFSLCTLDAPLGVDALAHTWLRVLLYVFPPLALITRTLARVRYLHIGQHCSGWQRYIRLLCTQPWQLPVCRHLLSKGGGMVFDLHPERLQLSASILPLLGSYRAGVSNVRPARGPGGAVRPMR